MSTYECERCHYASNDKSNFMRHLNRQKVCLPTFSTISIGNLKEKYVKEIDTTLKYKCRHCVKTYASRAGRILHEKKCTNAPSQDTLSNFDHNKRLDELTHQIAILRSELAESKQDLRPNPIVNSGNINTIHQYVNNNVQINLNNFGSETLEHLPSEFLTSCFMSKDIPTLIENIYFDDECPENHNVKLKSSKQKTMQVFADGKWRVKPANNVMDELVNKGQTILKKHYRGNKTDVHEEMTEDEIDDVLHWLNQIWHNNVKIRASLKGELMALFQTYKDG